MEPSPPAGLAANPRSCKNLDADPDGLSKSSLGAIIPYDRQKNPKKNSVISLHQNVLPRPVYTTPQGRLRPLTPRVTYSPS